MAIYHCAKKNFSRKTSNLASVVAYRIGSKLYSELEQITKYPHRNSADVLKVQTYNNPFSTIQEYVTESEKKFRQMNERITSEWEVSLPPELNHQQRNAIVDEFCENYAKRYNVTLIASTHNQKAGNGNYHCHIIAGERLVVDGSLGKKNRAIKPKSELDKTKKIYEDIVNKHLALNGIDKKVTRKNKQALQLVEEFENKKSVIDTEIAELRKELNSKRASRNRSFPISKTSI